MTRGFRALGLLLMASILALGGCAGSETSRSTGTYLDDAAISTKVKTELAGDSLLDAVKIEVETYDGVVQLSGFVDNTQTVEHAEKVARGVPGVKQVKNDLQVR